MQDKSAASNMSGFEIVGLILSVIPLVLEGIKAYPIKECYKSAEAFLQATQERRDFAMQLRRLNSELRYVIIELLTPINSLVTAKQRLVLTSRKSGGAKLFDVWKEIMKANSCEIEMTFKETFEDIRDVLEHMEDVMKEMVEHTDVPVYAGRELLRAIINNDRDDPKFSIKKMLSKRFKFAKSDSKRRVLIEQMGMDIKVLQALNKEQGAVEKFLATGNSIESQKSYGPRFLDNVRLSSCRLFHTLSNLWRCECHKSPSAMLRLERRETPESNELNCLRFSLIFTFEHSSDRLWAFQETEILVHQT